MRILNDIIGVLFPRNCEICERPLVDGEEILCLDCRLKIPDTGFHLAAENELTRRLTLPDVRIERATAFFHYRRLSDYAQLIHRGKYSDCSYILKSLSGYYARKLKEIGFLSDIDALIPVPMHWLKRLRRGYNQAEVIARAMGAEAGIPVMNCLKAYRGHATQTKRSATERAANISDIFRVVDPEALAGKHVALIDDIVTSGATILECARTLHAAVPALKVSVIALAATEKI